MIRTSFPEKELLKSLLSKYNYVPQAILVPQKGYRNTSYPCVLENGEKINLIIYKAEPDILSKIQVAHRASDYLASRNFPTRQTLGPILVINNPKEIRYACVYTYLPGQTIAWETYTMKHLKLLGAAMSDVHDGLKQLKQRSAKAVIDESMRLNEVMRRYSANPGVDHAIRAKLGVCLNQKVFPYFSLILEQCRLLRVSQLLHMDFVRGNILFENKPQLEISGILDFEKTVFGPREFDLARTIAFLIVDCKYKSVDKIYKYFLFSGYKKKGRTSFDNSYITINGKKVVTLKALVNFFLLNDFYKFLSHNPYEYLPLNEHFVRTRDFLLNRGILQYDLSVRPVGSHILS